MRPASIAGHVLELLMLADRRAAPVDRIVSEFFRKRHYLGSRDRRAISDTLFGFIRYRRTVETLLEGFLSGGGPYAPIDEGARRYVPLLVIYSLLFPGLFPGLSEGPVPPPSGDSPPVETDLPGLSDIRSLWRPTFPDLDPGPLVAWVRSHAGFDFIDEPPAVTLAVRYSFQDWMTAEWMERWPDEVEDLLGALNRPGEISLRVNTMKTNRESLLKRLSGEGISAEPTSYPPQGVTVAKRFNQKASPAFREGLFEVQDTGSQVVSVICDPKPGQLVIDGCAGAGGKTLHLADLMKNTGRLVAVDTDPGRLGELRKRCDRGGVTIVEPFLRKILPSEEYRGRADIVLVDAPCSGSGTIRRNPALKWSVSEGDVARYAARQADLLDGYAPLVRVGGRLVYSTCSLFRTENEEVAARFLGTHAGFRSAPAVPGDFPWKDDADGTNHVTLLPHRHGTDGFFIATFERVE